MKVLVSFENRVRPDSTGVYIVRAFEQLGHSVTHVLPEKIGEVGGGYDLYVKVDDGQKVTQWNPNLHPSHYYCIDTHIETDWRLELSKMFGTVSVVHSEGVNLPWGKEAIWIPVGCDPELHYNPSPAKEYDGCFIGNFHNNLAGPRIEMLDVFFKACPGPIYFGNKTFKDMAEKYGKSELVFNRSINGDVNMRVFEALCSGSCLVTDRLPDLIKVGLVEGIHYVGYSSADELAQVTADLLKDDERRESIARRGREEVLKNHTYAVRMSQLLDYLKTKENTNGLALSR